MTSLSTAAKKARQWTLQRDALICEARLTGRSFRAIAVDAGLSHVQVKNIVDREIRRKG